MNKESKRLIIEIILVIIIMLVAIPICANASSNYNKNKEQMQKYNIIINITNNKINKIVTLTNYNEDKVTINLVLKISKLRNKYKIKLDNNIYDLQTIEYTEDNDYNYYNLGTYEIKKEKNFYFQLIPINNNYEDNISYSFLAEPFK